MYVYQWEHVAGVRTPDRTVTEWNSDILPITPIAYTKVRADFGWPWLPCHYSDTVYLLRKWWMALSRLNCANEVVKFLGGIKKKVEQGEFWMPLDTTTRQTARWYRFSCSAFGKVQTFNSVICILYYTRYSVIIIWLILCFINYCIPCVVYHRVFCILWSEAAAR